MVTNSTDYLLQHTLSLGKSGQKKIKSVINKIKTPRAYKEVEDWNSLSKGTLQLPTKDGKIKQVQAG